MKLQRSIPHIAWCLATIGAFAIGKWTPSSHEPTVANATSMPTEDRSLLGQPKGQSAGSESTTATESELQSSAMMSETELSNIAREAIKDPNPLKRSLAFAKLLQSMTPENAAMIEKQMRELDAGGDEWRMFRYAWGAIDGQAAFAAASTIEDDRSRNRARSAAVSGWASAEPSDAIAWMNNLEAGDDKERLQEGLVSGLADNNITVATNYVLKLGDEGNRRADDYLEDVASEQLRSQGVDASARWSEQLPDGPLKGAAMDRVANAYVDQDPAAAAAWAERFAADDYAARVIEEVGDEWAERKPAEAVSWLESLPESEGKKEGMESALGEWVRRDPTAASEYLASMADSPTKDAAIGGFVSRLAWEDHDAAIAWASTIGQENQRTEALVDAARAFFRRDRDAAVAWLETSGLPPEAQKKVTESRRGRRD